MKQILIGFILASTTALAAPFPLSGTSMMNQLQSGVIFNQLGFTVQNFPQSWQLKKPVDGENVSLETGPTENAVAALSFHVDEVPVKTDLERYVRQYLRDYNQYGFEVIGIQSLKQTALNSVVVDLNQKNRKNRSRQVFYKKEGRIVTATCIDTFENFNKTIQTCNSVLQTFQWR